MEKQEHTIIDEKAQKYKQENLEIGVGLNEVDNLKPSEYFYTAIRESKTYYEIEEKLKSYYAKQDLHNTKTQTEKECDLVAIRIAQSIDENHFVLSPIALKSIHRRLFEGVFSQINEKYVGNFRDYNITKKESILNGESVRYGEHKEILEYLSYDFEMEKNKNYTKIPKQEWSRHIARFISNIWQIHPFIEGNTRTTAVFTIKYLNQIGIPCDNTIFKQHSIYFRNALVLASYGNTLKGISPDESYLDSFFNKLIVDSKSQLKEMPTNIMQNAQYIVKRQEPIISQPIKKQNQNTTKPKSRKR